MGLIILVACEKETVPVFDETQGYFEGTVNGQKVRSGEINKGGFNARLIFWNGPRECQDDGLGNLKLYFKNDSIETNFYIETIDKLKDKTYSIFHDNIYYGLDGCDKIPAISQYHKLERYKYIPDKGNYLKITKVGEKYIEGKFKVGFISKNYLQTGFQYFFPYALDSVYLTCNKFIAPIKQF